jgi:rhamnosyltransferase
MKISIIIPVKNGANTLGLCLQKIHEQTIKDIEILVLDSMSTDQSRDIALRYGATVIEVPDGTFNHGLTRNIGVGQAAGEFIFLTVQDAWIANSNSLEKMLKHFDNKEVMAVVGHQAVPHEKDKNPLYWYRPYSEPDVIERCVHDYQWFKSLPQNEQQALVAWDDVVAIYRKTALMQQPFIKTEFAEDWFWSYQALLKGWKLLRDSSFLVYHYHHQSYKYVFSSTYTLNYHFFKFFSYKPTVPVLMMPMLKSTYHIIKNQFLTVGEKFYWTLHNCTARVALYISIINFLIRLRLGGMHGIEEGYKLYCKKTPQGSHRK